MSDFQGMEELLQDFLVEASDLLSDVDNKLVDLERAPRDRALLNEIFRGFHTIKGGAGFLNATELVTLCHLTENLFDKLRTGELEVTAETMDVIMDATGAVRTMFGALENGAMPTAALVPKGGCPGIYAKSATLDCRRDEGGRQRAGLESAARCDYRRDAGDRDRCSGTNARVGSNQRGAAGQRSRRLGPPRRG